MAISFLDFVLLASAVYLESKPNLPPGFDKEAWQYLGSSNDYVELLTSGNSAPPFIDFEGYFGMAFLHKPSNVIVIAHRGTELTAINFLNVFKGALGVAKSLIGLKRAWQNISTDIGIAQGNIPNTKIFAAKFTKYILNKYNPSELIHTGHSLGGALSILCATFAAQRFVSFDAPFVDQHLYMRVEKDQTCDIKCDGTYFRKAFIRPDSVNFFYTESAINSLSLRRVDNPSFSASFPYHFKLQANFGSQSPEIKIWQYFLDKLKEVAISFLAGGADDFYHSLSFYIRALTNPTSALGNGRFIAGRALYYEKQALHFISDASLKVNQGDGGFQLTILNLTALALGESLRQSTSDQGLTEIQSVAYTLLARQVRKITEMAILPVAAAGAGTVGLPQREKDLHDTLKKHLGKLSQLARPFELQRRSSPDVNLHTYIRAVECSGNRQAFKRLVWMISLNSSQEVLTAIISGEMTPSLRLMVDLISDIELAVLVNECSPTPEVMSLISLKLMIFNMYHDSKLGVATSLSAVLLIAKKFERVHREARSEIDRLRQQNFILQAMDEADCDSPSDVVAKATLVPIFTIDKCFDNWSAQIKSDFHKIEGGCATVSSLIGCVRVLSEMNQMVIASWITKLRFLVESLRAPRDCLSRAGTITLNGILTLKQALNFLFFKQAVFESILAERAGSSSLINTVSDAINKISKHVTTKSSMKIHDVLATGIFRLFYDFSVNVIDENLAFLWCFETLCSDDWTVQYKMLYRPREPLFTRAEIKYRWMPSSNEYEYYSAQRYASEAFLLSQNDAPDRGEILFCYERARVVDPADPVSALRLRQLGRSQADTLSRVGMPVAPCTTTASVDPVAIHSLPRSFSSQRPAWERINGRWVKPSTDSRPVSPMPVQPKKAVSPIPLPLPRGIAVSKAAEKGDPTLRRPSKAITRQQVREVNTRTRTLSTLGLGKSTSASVSTSTKMASKQVPPPMWEKRNGTWVKPSTDSCPVSPMPVQPKKAVSPIPLPLPRGIAVSKAAEKGDPTLRRPSKAITRQQVREVNTRTRTLSTLGLGKSTSVSVSTSTKMASKQVPPPMWGKRNGTWVKPSTDSCPVSPMPVQPKKAVSPIPLPLPRGIAVSKAAIAKLPLRTSSKAVLRHQVTEVKVKPTRRASAAIRDSATTALVLHPTLADDSPPQTAKQEALRRIISGHERSVRTCLKDNSSSAEINDAYMSAFAFLEELYKRDRESVVSTIQNLLTYSCEQGHIEFFSSRLRNFLSNELSFDGRLRQAVSDALRHRRKILARNVELLRKSELESRRELDPEKFSASASNTVVFYDKDFAERQLRPPPSPPGIGWRILGGVLTGVATAAASVATVVTLNGVLGDIDEGSSQSFPTSEVHTRDCTREHRPTYRPHM